MNKNNKVFNIVLQGLFIALVCVMTMAIQVPVPFTNGYIHLGDSAILIIAVFFGRKYGVIAGGVGSMMADILSGYSHWAIPTLIIKSLMGFVAGSISKYENKKENFISINTFIATLFTVFVMVAGYFIASCVMEGTVSANIIKSIFPNIIQGSLGSAIFFVVGKALDKLKISKYMERYV